MLLSALLVLLALGGLIVLMGQGGWQAFAAFGPGFLIHGVWNPVTNQYGALSPLLGTVLSALLAICIAVPLAFGTAFWLTAIAPRHMVGTLIRICLGMLGVWGATSLDVSGGVPVGSPIKT